MPSSTRWNAVRRLSVCVGLGVLAPLGSIKVGSFAAATVVGVVLAVIAWIVWGMLDANDQDES
jgi:hypothetical protein